MDKERSKEQRDAANQRYKDKKQQERQDIAIAVSAAVDILKQNNLWSKVSKKSQEMLLKVANTNAGIGNSIVHKIFGNVVHVGDSVTLGQAFRLTMKGKAELDKKFSEWEKSEGVVVEFIENENDIFDSVYKIVDIKE